MKLALASDLYVDSYPDDQQIDWPLVRRWTGVDILVIGGNISGSPARTKREVLAAREAFDCVIFVEGDQVIRVSIRCQFRSGWLRQSLQGTLGPSGGGLKQIDPARTLPVHGIPV